MAEKPLLEIKELSVRFPVPGGEIHAVNGVDLSVWRGKTIGIVGESGCGKSVLASSILKLHPKSARIRGEILLNRESGSVNVAALSEKSRELGRIRGGEIAMIFQEPMRALFPLRTIGDQIGEAVRLHVTGDKEEIRRRSAELLTTVGIRNPEQRLKEYPHQFSGGMCQRVMIAIALASSPGLLIADEPTTALDVTIQAQVLSLLRRKQRELGMGILFITHDMGVIMEMADEIAVMYLGRIVEKAPAEELFRRPIHPYTRLLLKSIPGVGRTDESGGTDGSRGMDGSGGMDGSREMEGSGGTVGSGGIVGTGGSRGKRLATIEGNVPIPLNLKPGCGFCARCPQKCASRCADETPSLQELAPGHWAACFLYGKTGEKEGAV